MHLSHLTHHSNPSAEQLEVQISPNWTNHEEDVPKWMLSVLQPSESRQHDLDSKIRGSLCLLNRTCDPLLSLTYSGLMAPGRVVDMIGSLASPLKIPSPDETDSYMDTKPMLISIFAPLTKISLLIKNSGTKHSAPLCSMTFNLLSQFLRLQKGTCMGLLQ